MRSQLERAHLSRSKHLIENRLRWVLFAVLSTPACGNANTTDMGSDAGARDASMPAHDANVTTPDAPSAPYDAEAPMEPAIPRCATDLQAPLRELRVPGLSVGIVRDGRVACLGNAGVSDVETQEPLRDETLFLWASVTKTVTSTAAMLLAEDGSLDLDADINTYLPFPVRNPHCAGQPITPRQLMAHTSSLLDNESVYDASYAWSPDTAEPLLPFLQNYYTDGGTHYSANANFRNECPGSSSEYSNIAMGLLGGVIESAAGMPMDDFVRERLFAPLTMNTASLQLENVALSLVAATHHTRSNGEFERLGHPTWATFPDGGLRASVRELGRFLAMFTQDGAVGSSRLLSSSRVQEMIAVHDQDLDETQALGWYHEGPLVGHDGEDDGAASLMFFNPATGIGALVVSNGNWFLQDEDGERALALLRALIAEGDAMAQ